jgi:anti-sigma regulatory factor (Ser/Thr protein kinase)
MTSVRKFRAVPESVPAARRFVRNALRDQSRELIQAAELMTSELATNCVQHARTDFELSVRTQDQVRVELRDTNQRRPTLQSPKPEDQSGRGLRIVEALSDAWGIVTSPSGKTVWFALALQPELQFDASDRARPAAAASERQTDGGGNPGRRRRARGGSGARRPRQGEDRRGQARDADPGRSAPAVVTRPL